MLKQMRIYGLTFVSAILIFVLLLMAGCLLPQQLIDSHMRGSVEIFEKEKQHPRLGDRQDTAQLDNSTEALALQEAWTMNTSDLSRIFTNPTYMKKSAPREFRTIVEETPPARSYYVRYWQGFRTPIRLLLTFFRYDEIRIVLSWVLYGLFLFAMVNIGRHTDLRCAALFAVSFILMKPHVIAQSLHYSCCFLIAFIAIPLVPGITRKGREPWFMFLLGMVTMYFDFYSSPLVAMGYPLIYMLLLKTKDKALIRLTLYCGLAWLAGYALCWLAKLGLATVFTEVNGFQQGFGSFASRTGITQEKDLAEYYGVKAAFNAMKQVLFPEGNLSRAFLAAIIAALAFAGWKVWKKKVYTRVWAAYASLLVVVGMMILWYIVAAQPTAIHAYFQYRNIAIAVWALCLYYHLGLRPLRSAAAQDRPEKTGLHTEAE